MNTEINETKSCECKCRFDDGKCNLNQKWNNDKRWCECKHLKKYHACEKDYIWNLATCSCGNGKYVGSFIDNSLIMRDEIIEEKKYFNKF